MNRLTSRNTTNIVRKHQSKPQSAHQFLLGAITLAVFAFLCFFIIRSAPDTPSPIVAAPPQSELPASTQVRAAYGQLPLSFEVNRGQADKSVNYLARGAGYTLALSPTEAVFALASRSDKRSRSQSDNSATAIRGKHGAEAFAAHDSKPPTVLRMKLVGANRRADVEGLNELEGKVNYLIGSDRSQWRTNISTFARVRYTEVYPGIDVLYYGNQKHLEYDFVIAPGRDARAISLKFEGADKIEVDAAGDLLLSVSGSVIRQPKPIVYQEVDGERLEVAGNYVLARDGQVGFSVGAYDTQRPLVIDPTLVYSTYLGGSSSDAGNDIAVDSAGNAYVCGETDSPNFPTANALDATFGSGQLGGQRDAFVTKLNASGTALVYSTYLGGSGDPVITNINGDDRCFGIRVDASGNAYLAGETHSNDFPTANAIQATYGGGLSDAFVAKLNPSGSAFVFSTYLGGDIFDAAGGIALDSSNNIYITGRSTSSNYPTANPIQAAYSGGPGADVIITKLNASGTALVYSTYLGGNGGNGFENGGSIDVDSAGNAYITGQTSSTNFPTLNPIQATFGGGFPDGDAFITKINAAGTALVYSTYLGGSDNDVGADIDVDPAGVAHVAGFTSSSNFPTANALDATFSGTQDGFVTKLNAAGNAFAYSTYLGGSGSDAANDIAVDSAGNTHVVGGTGSTDFPTANAVQAALASSNGDTFVTKFNPGGSTFLYSTYFGGSGFERANAVALDSSNNAYVTGLTDSTNFPTLNPVQAAKGGGLDAFVYKLTDPATTTVQFNSSTTTNVQEDCTSIQLTIIRSGPTTGTTVVDYATTDGTAQQKFDYTIALGRLTFAPGETSKTITLLISEDSYVEGNETFTLNLSNATGGSVGTPGTATIQITDDPVEPTTNAIDDSAVFVCQQYHDLLMRQPESGGLQFYLDYLNGCQSTDTECIKFRRGAISTNFFHSPEFMQKGSFVMYLYMITLGQRPATAAELTDSTKVDRPHYTEFMMDLRNISDPNDDKAIVSALKDALTVAWLQRPEIQAIFGSLTNEQFVKKLESTAGVTLANESTLIANLNNSTQTRAQVLRAVAESPEVNAKFYRQAFVTMEYFGYLRREPESCFGNPNPNQCGYIFHNNGFNSASDPSQIEIQIVRGFIESPEYRQRFGP